MSEKEKNKELAEIVEKLIEHCLYIYNLAIMRERELKVLHELIDHANDLRIVMKEIKKGGAR